MEMEPTEEQLLQMTPEELRGVYTDERLVLMTPDALFEAFKKIFTSKLTRFSQIGNADGLATKRTLRSFEQAGTKFGKAYVENVPIAHGLWVLPLCLSMEGAVPIGLGNCFMYLYGRAFVEGAVDMCLPGNSDFVTIRLLVSALGTSLTNSLVKMQCSLTVERSDAKMRKVSNVEAHFRILNESFTWDRKYLDHGVVYTRMIRGLEEGRRELALIPQLQTRNLGEVRVRTEWNELPLGGMVNLNNVHARFRYIDLLLDKIVSISTRLELLMSFPLLPTPSSPDWETVLITNGRTDSLVRVLDWLHREVQEITKEVENISLDTSAFVEKYEAQSLEVINFQRKMKRINENMWEDLGNLGL